MLSADSPSSTGKGFNQIQSEGFLPSFPVVRISLHLSLAHLVERDQKR